MPAASDRSRSVRRRPRGQQHVALAEIDAGGPDMPPRCGGFGDGDVIAIDSRVFLDDDRIGAVRDDAAGEDSHGFALAYLAVERPPGGDLTDHLQPRREIGGIRRAHRVAVHRRHRLRRLRSPRGDVAREDTMIRGIERDHFLGQWFGAGQDRGKRIGNGHQGHGIAPRLRVQ